MHSQRHFTTYTARRSFLGRAAAVVAATALPWPATALAAPAASVASASALALRRIPSSGEMLPVIGLGSWITFNVGTDRRPRARPVSR